MLLKDLEDKKCLAVGFQSSHAKSDFFPSADKHADLAIQGLQWGAAVCSLAMR